MRQAQGGTQPNTAFIERLNASLRRRLAPLARRSRCLVRQAETLQAGMWVVGALYNFCDTHRSLRLKLWYSTRFRREGYRWVERTPALAAGLTDHVWTPPKRRGRPSNETRRLVDEWCI